MARKIICDRCGNEIETGGLTRLDRTLPIPTYNETTKFKIGGSEEYTAKTLKYKEVDLCDNCLESLAEWFTLCRVGRSA